MVKLTKVNVNPSSKIRHAESVRDYMENQESILFGKKIELKLNEINAIISLIA